MGVESTQETLEQKDLDRIFERELLPHIEALYSFACNLTYNSQDADDLVQETYMRAYRAIESFQSGTNAKAWLFQILKNVYINAYRKRSKQPVHVDYEDVSLVRGEEETASSSYTDLRVELFDKMLGDEVTAAINSLSSEYRMVIELREFDGFSYDEIAVLLDIPVGTVRSRLFRARDLLKEQLNAYAKAQGFKDNRS